MNRIKVSISYIWDKIKAFFSFIFSKRFVYGLMIGAAVATLIRYNTWQAVLTGINNPKAVNAATFNEEVIIKK